MISEYTPLLLFHALLCHRRIWILAVYTCNSHKMQRKFVRFRRYIVLHRSVLMKIRTVTLSTGDQYITQSKQISSSFTWSVQYFLFTRSFYIRTKRDAAYPVHDIPEKPVQEDMTNDALTCQCRQKRFITCIIPRYLNLYSLHDKI
jgi:hypothetical protein